MSLSESSLKRLEGLDPKFKVNILCLQGLAKLEGLDVQVACGYRSNEEQAKLYAQGRTVPGKIVTNAKPGQSKHNKGLAVDLYFIVNGKADWGVGKYLQLSKICVKNKLAISWSGNWKTFKEYCHFEAV